MTDENVSISEGSGEAGAVVAKNWFDGADAETLGYIQNKKWDDPQSGPLKIVESYRNLEKFHGVPADRLVKLPEKADDAAGWDGVYARLGRPESADKYGRDGLKLPEGAKVDDGLLGRFDNVFHKARLNKEQRDLIANAYIAEEVEALKTQTEKQAQDRAIQEESLKKDWGDKYGERVELARRALRTFLPDGIDKEQYASMFESQYGVAITAKLFANIADRMGEDSFRSGGGSDTERFGYTREQALSDRTSLFSELRADPVRLSKYNMALGADYEKIQRLNKIIAG